MNEEKEEANPEQEPEELRKMTEKAGRVRRTGQQATGGEEIEEVLELVEK